MTTITLHCAFMCKEAAITINFTPLEPCYHFPSAPSSLCGLRETHKFNSTLRGLDFETMSAISGAVTDGSRGVSGATPYVLRQGLALQPTSCPWPALMLFSRNMKPENETSYIRHNLVGKKRLNHILCVS